MVSNVSFSYKNGFLTEQKKILIFKILENPIFTFFRFLFQIIQSRKSCYVFY